MSLSWANPPPVVLVGGTEEFLVRRELKNAILSAHKSGIRTEFATSDSEAVDILTGASTFGDTCLVHIDAKEVSEQTVQEVLENPVEKVCLLIHCPYEVNPKKFPFIKLLFFVNSSSLIKYLYSIIGSVGNFDCFMCMDSFVKIQ